MDIQAYIESGILELYASGALPPAEAREVEAVAEQYPEIKARIRQIQDTLDAFALAHAREPRAGLKQEFLAKFEKENLPPKRKNGLLALGWVLAFAGFLLSGMIYFYCQNVEKELEQLKLKQIQLENNAQKAIAQLETIAKPDTKYVVLQGMGIAQGKEASLFWNEAQGKAYLSAGSLPPPPPGKQYQLWSIADDIPYDAGLLLPGVANLQSMNEVTKAQAFAITLEKEGGSPTPTLDQMVAMGAISG